MDLPPELKQEVFLLLTEDELKIAEKVFPEVINNSYFKASHQYTYNTLTACCGRGLIEGVRLHLNRTKEINHLAGGVTPLHCAVGQGRADIVQVLLNDPRVDVNATTIYGYESHDSYTRYEDTPLFRAMYHGFDDIVRILLSDSRINLNHMDSRGRTPLYLATEFFDTETVQLLLNDPRVDVNLTCVDGFTAFFIAKVYGNKDMLELFKAAT